MRVVEVPHGGIPAHQQELAQRRARAAFLQQPEHALDGDVHHFVGRFLAGGQVQDVRGTFDSAPHVVTVLDGSRRDLQAWMRRGPA